MARRYTIQDDHMIVQFFDAVGPALVNDIGKSWASIQKRAKVLRESGTWDAIITEQQFAWIAVRHRELISPTKRLMDLDMIHPGSMIHVPHFNDLMTAKEYADHTAEFFEDCKRAARSGAHRAHHFSPEHNVLIHPNADPKRVWK